MNNVFLMWRLLPSHAPAALSGEAVALRLATIFDTVYSAPPPVTVREEPHGSVVLLEPGIENWRLPFSEEDPTGWIHAIDYPLDVKVALDEAGLASVPGRPLSALRRGLSSCSEQLLLHLAPPFSVVWSTGGEGNVCVQNDGLGQSQLFEYRDEEIWILTNRVACLSALGVRLEPVPVEWGARCTLGWFPLFTTGFRNVRQLPGGTRIRLDAAGVHHDRQETLERWLQPPARSDAEWLEAVCQGMLKRIRAAAAWWSSPRVGLSGGWDSRAVVACLRHAGVDFRARVKGRDLSEDVAIARELARIAGFDILHERSGELPAADADATASSISRMVLWQAGQTDAEKHKTAFVGDSRIRRGNVNIMGQHGELGRGTQYVAGIEWCREHGIPVSPQVKRAIAEQVPDFWFARRPHALRRDLHGPVRSLIDAAFGEQAMRFGLSDFKLLDFFYLHEITRRRSAGSLSSQGDLVFAPFLQPAFIQAVFADSTIAGHEGTFHHYLIERCAPDWAKVRFTSKGDYPIPEEVAADKERTEIELNFYERRGSRYYDAGKFWRTIGRPLIDTALAEGGFWTEVLDEELVRATPIDAPDDLTMLHEVARI